MGFPGFLEFSGIFGVLESLKGALGFKIDSKLFLELLPSFLIPGLLGLVLPGSFRGLGCSKIRFPNSRDPDTNRIGPFRAFVNGFAMNKNHNGPIETGLDPYFRDKMKILYLGSFLIANPE